MRAFFENCATLLGAVSNPSSAFSLCSAKYGEEKGAEQPEGQPYDAAQQAFDEAFALIGGDWSPAQEVLGGILDFIAAEATIETAQVLQRRWEDEVLNSPTVLFGRGGGEAIFGETGVVPVFVQKNLGTLLSHRGGVPVPSLWDGTPFPFDDEFLAALMQGAEAASQPLPPERKESYRVSVASRPLIVNQGAQLRPSVMTLTLEGDDGPQQLVNQNFPQEAVFTYSPGKSGRVTLVISFPGFDLRREYAGFKEFVTEFRTGEKTFFQMDFPGAFDAMEAAGLKTIKVPHRRLEHGGHLRGPEGGGGAQIPRASVKYNKAGDALMNSLRTIFRWMLLVWLVLVAALGFAVSRGTHTTYAGNTMAFLFSSAGREKVELPPAVRRAAPPVAEEPPAEPPAPEWTPLAKGKTAGSGTLGAPEIQTLDGDSVAVVMSLTGTIGDVSFYSPKNVTGATVDFIGEWSKPPYMKKSLSDGCLSLVQAAGHKGYLRISGVAAHGVAKLEARAEYSAGKNAVRVVFSPAGAEKGK